MSALVDVLAVWDRQMKFTAAVAADYPGATDDHRDLVSARAAVAELIEAAVEFRAGIAALVICQEQEAPQDIYDAVAERFKKAADRQDAALARVGGAA